MLKAIIDWLRTPLHSSLVLRRVSANEDPLEAYYEELATPPDHMRELARRRIGLMSDMNGR